MKISQTKYKLAEVRAQSTHEYKPQIDKSRVDMY